MSVGDDEVGPVVAVEVRGGEVPNGRTGRVDSLRLEERPIAPTAPHLDEGLVRATGEEIEMAIAIEVDHGDRAGVARRELRRAGERPVADARQDRDAGRGAVPGGQVEDPGPVDVSGP